METIPHNFGVGKSSVVGHYVEGFSPSDVIDNSIWMEEGDFLGVQPDEDSCPLFVGWKEYEEPVTYLGHESRYQPLFRRCKSRACSRCSGIDAWLNIADYSKLYRGNPDAWFFVTLTGGGWDSRFRHSSLNDQITSLKGSLSTFLNLMNREIVSLDSVVQSNLENVERLSSISSEIHELDDELSFLRVNMRDSPDDSFYRKQYSVVKEKMDSLKRQVAQGVFVVDADEEIHLNNSALSFIGAIETKINLDLVDKHGPHQYCSDSDCLDNGHFHTHLHLHVFAPSWYDAMYKMKSKNQPVWKLNKKGDYLPPKQFRSVFRKNVELSGFGSRFQIGRLNMVDMESSSTSGAGYIFKNYIMKELPDGGTHWYRNQVKDAFRGRKRWWRSGPMWNESKIKFPRLRKSKQRMSADNLSQLSGLLSPSASKEVIKWSNILADISSKDVIVPYNTKIPRFFLS